MTDLKVGYLTRQAIYQGVHLRVGHGTPTLPSRFPAKNFLRHYSEGERFMSIAVLHESVALMGMIGRDTETENWLPWEHGWKPSPGVGIVPVTHR